MNKGKFKEALKDALEKAACTGYLAVVTIAVFSILIPILYEIVFPFWDNLWQECGATLTTCWQAMVK